jgi:hypothetical protein
MGEPHGGGVCDFRSAAVTALFWRAKVQAMVKHAAVILLVMGIGGTVRANEGDVLVRFNVAIGSNPVASPAGPVNGDGTFPNVTRNVVRGVNPGGGIWRIADLRAQVDTDGHITVRGRGLLLASGNSIGRNANQSVFATLICEAAAPFVERSTTLTGVPLDPNGDFRIDDTLNQEPQECASPLLLIRSSGSGAWFAAGIAGPAND